VCPVALQATPQYTKPISLLQIANHWMPIKV